MLDRTSIDPEAATSDVEVMLCPILIGTIVIFSARLIPDVTR
jgi:hypothetical protein